MAKLTEKKIRWLVDQVVVHKRPPREVAPVQSVTVRRVQQLVAHYRATGAYPVLRNPGRKKVPLTPKQHIAIEEAWRETRLSARLLYHELQRRGTPVPKNKLYAYLRRTSRVVPNKRKQRQRKRCRYEREHAGSLVHGDWHRTSKDHPQCILWLDDASRKILAGREDKHVSANASVHSLGQAILAARQYNLTIREVNTDRGSEFHSVKGGTSRFRHYLNMMGIRHVLSRPYNPQTNGKLERLWLEYDRHRWRFNTLREWIMWYNARLHGALLLEWAETPDEAFLRKLPPECLVGLVFT